MLKGLAEVSGFGCSAAGAGAKSGSADEGIASADGILIMHWHWGHLAREPACLSETLSCLLHCWQLNVIGIRTIPGAKVEYELGAKTLLGSERFLARIFVANPRWVRTKIQRITL